MRALEQLVAATDQLGSNEFYPTLLGLGSQITDARSAQVIYFKPSGPPDYLHVLHTPKITRQLYQEHYFDHCPMGHHWQNHRSASVVPLREARQPDTDYDEYFNVFCRSNAVRDDVGMFLPIGDEHAVGLFFEQDQNFETWTIQRLKRLLPTVLRLHKTHIRMSINALLAEFRLRPSECKVTLLGKDGVPILCSDGDGGFSPPGHGQASRVDQSSFVGASAHTIGPLPPLFPLAPGGFLQVEQLNTNPEQMCSRLEKARSVILTQRERDVLALIFGNHSVKAIASHLALSVNTVKSHRRRLFKHLGVHSERELFSLLISH